MTPRFRDVLFRGPFTSCLVRYPKLTSSPVFTGSVLVFASTAGPAVRQQAAPVSCSSCSFHSQKNRQPLQAAGERPQVAGACPQAAGARPQAAGSRPRAVGAPLLPLAVGGPLPQAAGASLPLAAGAPLPQAAGGPLPQAVGAPLPLAAGISHHLQPHPLRKCSTRHSF